MRRRAGALLSAALLLAVVGLVALQVAGPWEDPSPAGEPRPRPWPAAHEEPRVALGVTTAALARNAYRPWSRPTSARSTPSSSSPAGTPTS